MWLGGPQQQHRVSAATAVSFLRNWCLFASCAAGVFEQHATVSSPRTPTATAAMGCVLSAAPVARNSQPAASMSLSL